MCYNTNTTHHHTGGIILTKNYPTWTARIPPDVKEYLQNKKCLSAGQCLCEYYKILKSNELDEAVKELSRRKEGVLQQELIVTHLQNKCNTHWVKCNTIFESFKSQGRDIHKIDGKDRFWIKSQLEKNKITSISEDQFIEHFQEAK